MPMLKIIRTIVLVVIMAVPLPVFASSPYHEESPEMVQKELSYFTGEYYDKNGNVILTIKDGYINGCKVITGFNFAGKGFSSSNIFRIIENNGYRDIHIDGEGYDEHEMVIIDGTSVAYKTQKPRYFESVGGIYIGMSGEDILKLYGQPSRRISGYQDVWYYDNLGLKLQFARKSVVNVITFYNSGNRHFDYSGFNCKDSLESYYYKYNLDSVPKRGSICKIGHGEFLVFTDYPNSMSLAITP